jgi:hypothetical protein
MKRSVRRFAVVVLVSVCALASGQINDDRAVAQSQGQKNPFAAEIEKKIAGQESKPAEEVFKNIQIFKGMPASRVLAIMSIAFNAGLGVDCTHCHTAGEWEKEDKEAKQTARKMWLMMPKVNSLIKETIGRGQINCTTCHRGQVKPALNLSKQVTGNRG